MKEILPCPTAEELEAETQAHFAKEVAVHGARAQDLLNRLLGKGIEAAFQAESSYNSFSTEAFGLKIMQRHLTRRGWDLRYTDQSQLRRNKWFDTLNELLAYVENMYFPQKDWGIFDEPNDERLDAIYAAADKLSRRVTIETRPDAGKIKVAVFVIESDGNKVHHHGVFGKMSEGIASLEAHFNIN